MQTSVGCPTLANLSVFRQLSQNSFYSTADQTRAVWQADCDSTQYHLRSVHRGISVFDFERTEVADQRTQKWN